ncbi:hypothetical protein SAMN05216225_100555 [Ornithinibacillus halophilus]|uniref:Uncharacterized protein n=1 Tax=Ornithinibacillus halophilus TaxID=930117 RepID=A0A1M5EKA7_9BACI|nr:hypothetical protein SAMN05216225_100555 [Ornithinibacillus halophilus]
MGASDESHRLPNYFTQGIVYKFFNVKSMFFLEIDKYRLNQKESEYKRILKSFHT